MTSVFEQESLKIVELKHCPFCGDGDVSSYVRGGMTGIVRGSRLDLDEHDGAAVDGDQIEFAQPRPITAREDDVSLSSEIAFRLAFSSFAERGSLPNEPHPLLDPSDERLQP